MSTHYETLGVPTTATPEEIKKAYRAKAFEFHPDNKETGSEVKFKSVNEAYQVLSDEEKKQRYDNGEDEAPWRSGNGFPPDFFSRGGGFGGMNQENIEEFFRHFNHQQENQQHVKQPDAHIQVTLKDILLGKEEEIFPNLILNCVVCNGVGFENKDGNPIEENIITCLKCNGSCRTTTRYGNFMVQVPCQTCNGRGKYGTKITCKACNGQKHSTKQTKLKIKIPPGIRDGNFMEFGVVVDGIKTKAGIMIHVIDHPVYEMDDSGNVKATLKISYPEAVLGGVKTWTLIDETQISVKIPQGTTPGKVMRVNHKGVPRTPKNPTDLGDMYLVVEVDIPTNLSENQIKALKDFQNTL